MTTAELKRIYPNASRSTIRANEILEAAKNIGQPVAGRLQPKLQRVVPQALDCHASKQAKRTKGPVLCHVLINRVGRRTLDDDNLAASYKGLRDSIALRLGIDDGDSRIKFEYAQVMTNGATGTHVIISM